MNQGWTYCDRIQPAAAGQTVLTYYTQRYQHSSEAEWQTRIEQGQILLNGEAVAGDECLQTGQALSYYRLPWQEPSAPLDFGVLYEDDAIWVIDKPSGLPVLPGGQFLEHTLLHQLRKRYPHASPIPVHRLGRGTSGAILVAKSQTARSQLARQFRIRTATDEGVPTLTKVYRALIGPTDEQSLPQQVICEHPIGKVSHTRLGYLFSRVNNGEGMKSRSDVTVLERRNHSTLVEVAIKTGRPHQIRIHLAAAGFPLLGDPLYVSGGVAGGDVAVNPGEGGYWLHAHQLGFRHPTTEQQILVTAPLPPVLMRTKLICTEE